MATTTLKEHFSKLLKTHIKKAGLRQLDIAEALGLSASAVCQMLSGKISPNLKQLDIITERLSLDRNECAELRDCLSRIRSGDDELRSPLNDFIHTMRTQHGLSIEQLSEMSGISEDTLYMLENKLNVQPSPYEAVRLAAIFHCQVGELWQVVPENANAGTTDTSPYRGSSGGSEYSMLNDCSRPYGGVADSGIKIPIVNINDLKRFDPRCDVLVEFAWRHMCAYETDHKFGVVIVKAPGLDFGWAEFYDALIEVIDNREWIPGMSVLASVDGEILLGRATEEQYKIIPIGDEEVLECQWYAMVIAFRFASDLLEVVNQRKNERKRHQRRVAIKPVRQARDNEDQANTVMGKI